MTETPETKAFDEGEQAALSDKGEDTNPYFAEKGTVADAWARGHYWGLHTLHTKAK